MQKMSRNVFLSARAGLALAAFLAAQPLHAEPPPPRTITVSGEGEIKAVPDEAILTAGVVTQSPSAEDALAANRRAMNAVFAELKRRGIPDRAIQTSEFNVVPQYETPQNGSAPAKIAAYQVSNNVTVTVSDLTKLGPAIDALVASGANSMRGVSFTFRDAKPFLHQAREAAVKDAIERAQVYARAAGVALGRILSIGEGGASAPRPMFRTMNAVAEATPMAAGEETLSAQVTVVFEIR